MSAAIAVSERSRETGERASCWCGRYVMWADPEDTAVRVMKRWAEERNAAEVRHAQRVMKRWAEERNAAEVEP